MAYNYVHYLHVFNGRIICAGLSFSFLILVIYLFLLCLISLIRSMSVLFKDRFFFLNCLYCKLISISLLLLLGLYFLYFTIFGLFCCSNFLRWVISLHILSMFYYEHLRV